jgi:hypothetical protein
VTALGALVIAGALSVVALPAEASTAYRYWSYWNVEPGSGTWQYATEGSGTHVPSDGAVEGWRFGIAGEATRLQPSPLPDFPSICAEIDAPGEGKRVAVVIDPGTPSEAPAGETPGSVVTECVVTDDASTGLQILQTIANVRMNAGFVCGLNGYPVRECAPLVEIPEASNMQAASSSSQQDTPATNTSSSQPSDESSASGTPLITAIGISILALVGFGIWRHRRRERV